MSGRPDAERTPIMPGWSAPFSVTGQSNQGSQEQAVMSRENFSCSNRRGGMFPQMPAAR
jgi:hypothetical protein